ncbi:hypothetical protein GLYMA_16G047001v4 [Glycine max]|nr:hypothetical protein GLYMA_16G047001v4 [Glycine max]KAH1149993.1 hypothetical protein GYH30_044155 [Glycine max]
MYCVSWLSLFFFSFLCLCCCSSVNLLQLRCPVHDTEK